MAGSLLRIVIAALRQGRSTPDLFGSIQFSLRVESEDDVVWGMRSPITPTLLEPAGQDAHTTSGDDDTAILGSGRSLAIAADDEEGPPRRRASARTFSIQTYPDWAGILVLTIRRNGSDGASAVPIALVQERELNQFTQDIATFLGDHPDPITPPNPMEGTDEFEVSRVMQEAGTLAAELSESIGPLISVNVRNHQESLNVMGGFESRAPGRLIGARRVLRSDLITVVGAVRRRMDAPNAVRLAHQTLIRRGLQDQAAGPVIFIEVSAPMDVGFGAAELGLLQQELIGGTDQKTWSFVTRYEENRIRVFGRVGPFSVAPQPGELSTPTML